MKSIISIFIGSVMALGLLFLMTNLIAEPVKENTPKVKVVEPPIVVEEQPEPPKINTTPQPPSASIEPSFDISDMSITNTEISPLEPITLEVGVSTTMQLSELVSLGTNSELGLQDRAAMTIYESPARYPIDARINGIEGWVKLSYDIDESGLANNIKVLDSHPNNIFDKEARRALKRWKFKAPIENGVAVSVFNQAVTMAFELDTDLAQE